MRKLLFSLILMLFATPAMADYTFVIPQKPGGGTSVCRHRRALSRLRESSSLNFARFVRTGAI